MSTCPGQVIGEDRFKREAEKQRMKKLFYIFLPILFGLLFIAPQLCLGQDVNFDITPPISGDLPTVIGDIVQLMFAFAGIVALIYLILGGYNYIMAGGNPEMQEAAKKTITNAIIGLVVIIISYLIIQFILGPNGLNVSGITL